MNLLPLFRKKNSGEIARNRLKLLLVADKTDCSPEIVEMLRDDMIHVISKYMDIDSKEIRIQMTKTQLPGHQEAVPALYANIPIRDKPYKGTS